MCKTHESFYWWNRDMPVVSSVYKRLSIGLTVPLNTCSNAVAACVKREILEKYHNQDPCTFSLWLFLLLQVSIWVGLQDGWWVTRAVTKKNPLQIIIQHITPISTKPAPVVSCLMLSGYWPHTWCSDCGVANEAVSSRGYSNRVVGGEDSLVGEWPWQVAILTSSDLSSQVRLNWKWNATIMKLVA